MAKILLKDVRGAFLNIFEAKAVEAGGEPRYSGCFILDPKAAYIKEINAGMVAVAKEKWKDKGPAILEELKKKGRVCYTPGPRTNEEGVPYAGFEGMHAINASNKAAPTVIDRDKSQLSKSSGRPYSGSFVNASIELWAQDNQYGKRINATLRGVQFVRDGDAFGGGAPASPDEFEDLGTEAESLVD